MCQWVCSIIPKAGFYLSGGNLIFKFTHILNGDCMFGVHGGTNQDEVPALNFTFTLNQVYVLLQSANDLEDVSRLMRLVAGKIGQGTNQEKK